MISKPILTKQKYKMSYFEYIFTHCIPTGFNSFRYAFYFWIRLMQGDTSDYDYRKKKFNDTDEELFQMLRTDFWWELEDDVLPKQFLESLYEQVEDIHSGKVKLYTIDNIDDLLNENYDDDDNEI